MIISLNLQAGNSDAAARQQQLNQQLIALQADLTAAVAKLNASGPSLAEYVASYNDLALITNTNYYTCYKSLFSSSSSDFSYDSDGYVQFWGKDAFYNYLKTAYGIDLTSTTTTTTQGPSTSSSDRKEETITNPDGSVVTIITTTSQSSSSSNTVIDVIKLRQTTVFSDLWSAFYGSVLNGSGDTFQVNDFSCSAGSDASSGTQ